MNKRQKSKVASKPEAAAAAKKSVSKAETTKAETATTETVNNEILKAEPAKKEAVKKTTKKSIVKKDTAKPAAVKKAKATPKKAITPSVALTIQYGQQETTQEQLVTDIKKKWKEDGNLIKDITDLHIYVKPEEGMAYYVVNHSATGSLPLV